MHAGKSYKFSEFLIWTRVNIYWLLLIGIIPTFLYEYYEIKWIAIPWTVVSLLGTATAFLVGFKNTQTYNRTWEARQIWGSIINSSRSWGIMNRDFLDNDEKSRELIYFHFAWLTALRYQMRESRVWETAEKSYNKEYKNFYSIPEKKTSLETELSKYLPEEKINYILGTKNKAVQIMSLQSRKIKELLVEKDIDMYQFIEMNRAIKDFLEHQGKSERIKNFPYPRQFATINAFFIKLFCFLLPFGMLKEFDKLNDGMNGLFQGNMVWLVIPFSILISWVYTSLEQVGESTENPFEGSPNDIPISQISRTIEIDLREMLGEKELPPPILPQNNIVL